MVFDGALADAEIGGDVAGVVDQIDEVSADQFLHRIGEGHLKLIVEVIAQRFLARQQSFKIGAFAIEAAA